MIKKFLLLSFVMFVLLCGFVSSYYFAYVDPAAFDVGVGSEGYLVGDPLNPVGYCSVSDYLCSIDSYAGTDLMIANPSSETATPDVGFDPYVSCNGYASMCAGLSTQADCESASWSIDIYDDSFNPTVLNNICSFTPASAPGDQCDVCGKASSCSSGFECGPTFTGFTDNGFPEYGDYLTDTPQGYVQGTYDRYCLDESECELVTVFEPVTCNDPDTSGATFFCSAPSSSGFEIEALSPRKGPGFDSCREACDETDGLVCCGYYDLTATPSNPIHIGDDGRVIDPDLPQYQGIGGEDLLDVDTVAYFESGNPCFGTVVSTNSDNQLEATNYNSQINNVLTFSYTTQPSNPNYHSTALKCFESKQGCSQESIYDQCFTDFCTDDSGCAAGEYCDVDWQVNSLRKVCHANELTSVIGGKYAITEYYVTTNDFNLDNDDMPKVYTTQDVNTEVFDMGLISNVCIGDVPKRPLLDGSDPTWISEAATANQNACDCTKGGAGELMTCYTDVDDDGYYAIGSKKSFCVDEGYISSRIDISHANANFRRTKDVLYGTSASQWCTLDIRAPMVPDCDDDDPNKYLDKVSPFETGLLESLPLDRCSECGVDSNGEQLIAVFGTCMCPGDMVPDVSGTFCETAPGDCPPGEELTTYYPDADGDGYGSLTAPAVSFCDSEDTTGYSLTNDDCADDPAGSCVPRSTYTGCIGLDYSSCTAGSNNIECRWLDGSGIVSPDEINPGAVEACNTVDDNCDGFVDESAPGGECYQPGPLCIDGVFDCSNFNLQETKCSASGCSYDSISGICSGLSSCGNVPTSYCVQAGCTLNNLDCGSLDAAFGIGTGNSCDDKRGCKWTCDEKLFMEIPSNNFDDSNADGDNDLDTGVDCQDSVVQSKSTWTDKEARSGLYTCAGTNQDSDYAYTNGLSHYCAVGESDASVHLCCPVGQKLNYKAFDDEWECIDSAPCIAPVGACAFDYASAFVDWYASAGCVDTITPSACCQVVQYGEFEYYSDSDNVKVY